MSVEHYCGERLRRPLRACRNLPPEAVRWVRGQGPGAKRIYLFSGMVCALGLSGLFSFRVQELIAALVLFTAGFGALFLIALVCMLADSAVQEGATGIRVRVPQWYRAGRNGMLEFAHPLRSVQVLPRWKHKVPAPAVPSGAD